MNQNDLRVIKTRKNIEDSFIKLLNEKDFNKITVQDLLDTALINRTTFYKHYSDKYELAEGLCKTTFALFAEHVEKRFQCSSAQDVFHEVEELYLALSKQRIKILALFKIHTESIHLFDDMSDFLKNSFRKVKPEESDYPATLYAVIVMTTIKWCLEHDGFEELNSHISDFYVLMNLFKF